MLSTAGSTANVHRRQVTVRTGFRGDTPDEQPSILDRFFGPPWRNVRVIGCHSFRAKPRSWNICVTGQAESGAIDRKPPVRFRFRNPGQICYPAAARLTPRQRFDMVAVKSVNTRGAEIHSI